MHVFEGALLGDVLTKIGVPSGKAIRGVDFADMSILEAPTAIKLCSISRVPIQ